MKKTILVLLTAVFFGCNDDPLAIQNQNGIPDMTFLEKYDLSVLSKLNTFDSLNKFLLDNFDVLSNYNNKGNDLKIPTVYPLWACDSVGIQLKNCFGIDKKNYDNPDMPDNLIESFKSSLHNIDTTLFFSISICQNKQIHYFFKEKEISDSVLIIHSLVYNRKTKKECLYQYNRDSVLNDKYSYRILQNFNYKAVMRKMNGSMNNGH